jgi:hypothetical protein
MNIYVYDRDRKLVAKYVNVGIDKLMEVANEMMCYRPSIHDFSYECVKGFISVETDESFL